MALKQGLHLILISDIHFGGITGPDRVFFAENFQAVPAKLAICSYDDNAHDQVLRVDASSSRSIRYWPY